MAEYIEKTELIKKLCFETAEWYYSPTIKTIKEFPAADVQPVKHGEWRKKFLSDTICCSECKVTWSSSFKDMLNGFNYCPNCGARMDCDAE